MLLCIPACTTTACAPPPPNLDPAGMTAFNQQRIQNALDQPRDVVQKGYKTVPPMFSYDTTLKVTNWHESAIKIVHTGGTGWKLEVETGMDEFLGNLPPNERLTLQPYFVLAKTILTQVTQ